MISETIDYLKDPHLVARIQRYFGVRISNKHDKKKTPERETKVDNELVCNKNGINKESFKNIDEADKYISLSDDDQENPLVTNYFWHYLFLFGTELGDEIFYSSFIPFWFWNVDGAVGRRVVLVWATVMTIGLLFSFSSV